MPDVRLAELQTSKSNWHARRARVLLQHRATQREIDAEAQAHLRDLYASHENVDVRLRAMWALHVSGLLTSEKLLEALDDDQEYVRAWAVQLLTEDLGPRPRRPPAFCRDGRVRAVSCG